MRTRVIPTTRTGSAISTYDDLSSVYEQLTPEALRTPEGNVAAFATVIDALPPGARVLDAACGIGLLATGLALRGFRTEATDASPGMVAHTRATAAKHHAELRAGVCAWEDLPPGPRFDAVFCVGNSIGHARDRRAALRALAATLKPGRCARADLPQLGARTRPRLTHRRHAHVGDPGAGTSRTPSPWPSEP